MPEIITGSSISSSRPPLIIDRSIRRGGGGLGGDLDTHLMFALGLH